MRTIMSLVQIVSGLAAALGGLLAGLCFALALFCAKQARSHPHHP